MLGEVFLLQFLIFLNKIAVYVEASRERQGYHACVRVRLKSIALHATVLPLKPSGHKRCRPWHEVKRVYVIGRLEKVGCFPRVACACVRTCGFERFLYTFCCSGTGNSGSASETISRGSSSILDEIDDLDGFAPDTPPQVYGLLAAECSSENEPHTDESHMCH